MAAVTGTVVTTGGAVGAAAGDAGSVVTDVSVVGGLDFRSRPKASIKRDQLLFLPLSDMVTREKIPACRSEAILPRGRE